MFVYFSFFFPPIERRWRESFWEPSFKQALKRLFVGWRKSSCRGCGLCGVHPSAGEITSLRRKLHGSHHLHECLPMWLVFIVQGKKNIHLKSFLLKNLFSVYSPGTQCSAFIMAQASEQDVRCFRTSGFSHSALFCRAGDLNQLKNGQRGGRSAWSRGQGTSWALAHWQYFVVSTIKL